MTTIENCNNLMGESQYNKFLGRSKPLLKQRNSKHLDKRQNELVDVVNIKTIAHLNELEVKVDGSHTTAFNVDHSIFNHANNEMNRIVDNWSGPIITSHFKEKCDKQKDNDEFVVFYKQCENWIDQNSYKASGNHFFKYYIQSAVQYLRSYCQYILNINPQQRRLVAEYLCICFIYELLQDKIKMNRRSGPKPLLRIKTLHKSRGIHAELETLFHTLDINKLRKNKPKIFHQNISKFVHDLYNQKKDKLITNELQNNSSPHSHAPTPPNSATDANMNNNNHDYEQQLRRENQDLLHQLESLRVLQRQMHLTVVNNYNYNNTPYQPQPDYIPPFPYPPINGTQYEVNDRRNMPHPHYSYGPSYYRYPYSSQTRWNPMYRDAEQQSFPSLPPILNDDYNYQDDDDRFTNDDGLSMSTNNSNDNLDFPS